MDHRKLSVELAEVIIKWDVMLANRDDHNIPPPDANNPHKTEGPNSYVSHP